MGTFDRRRTGEVWENNKGETCLIVDDDPDMSGQSDLSSCGFTFSSMVFLTSRDRISDLYSANPNYTGGFDPIYEVNVGADAFAITADWFVDLCQVINASNNSFENLLGVVSEDAVLDLLIRIEEFNMKQAARDQGRRHPPASRKHYEFDVAISFAGEQRELARTLANQLRDFDVSVFFDEFETSSMWGSDLAQYLDAIYRKKARYCIPIISKVYKIKIWTRHELRSALSRRLFEAPDYILPLRFDDTELDGLQPTTGYLRFESEANIQGIVDVFIKKLRGESRRQIDSTTTKWVENINKINGTWGIDCTAFVLDRRYITSDEEGAELRLGVSYGINITIPRAGFLAPQERQGANVLGVHVVHIDVTRRMTLADRWITAEEAGDVDSTAAAMALAISYLSAIEEADYVSMVKGVGSGSTVFESDFFELDEVEVDV